MMKKILSSLFMMIMVFTSYAQSCPDEHHPHLIDLGLPSGTKWACCNVGADKPEDNGGYYAWGETEEKTFYDWSTYIHCDGGDMTCHDLGDDIAGTQYDVAHVKWGDSWVMPSSKQLEELKNYCVYGWEMVNGVDGVKYTSKINRGSIFFPAVGYRWGDELNEVGNGGLFWLSTQGPSSSNFSYVMFFDFFTIDESFNVRSTGSTVRPVISGPTINAQICPDEHHPHMIDLGLPSGTKWACCNVGADKPEAKGSYYAWGETEEKEAYNEVTYQYCTGENPNSYGWYGQNSQYQYLADDIAGTQYDVAHVKWGGSWVMPSVDKFKELINNCTHTFISLNGVNGQMFTNNGVTIFLPTTDDYYQDYVGEYWTSTQEPSSAKWAYYLYFTPEDLSLDYLAHPLGNPVRPVISETNRINLPESSSDISKQAIYNIYGIKVADNADNTNNLPSGIYIVNGKKMVIK